MRLQLGLPALTSPDPRSCLVHFRFPNARNPPVSPGLLRSGSLIIHINTFTTNATTELFDQCA